MSIVLMSPEEIVSRMNEAIIPLVERLDAIEKRLVQGKICYSTKEIGALLSVSPRVVSIWIKLGKTDQHGNQHYLEGHELVKGRYAIEMHAVLTFISHF